MRLHLRRLPGRRLLLVALCLCILAGCRAEEPPASPQTADGATVWVEPGAPAAATPEPASPLESIEENVPAPEPVSAPDAAVPPPQTSSRPLAAIIIDDMGYNRQIGHQLLQIQVHLSFSFLPQAPFTVELAQQAAHMGRDILVHLPMEPKEKKWQLEPGTLLATDSPDQIRKKIEEMLTLVPLTTGASNHMGSRFSEDAARMRVVIAALKTRSLFFVDSFTSPVSQGLVTARRVHLPATRRHLFLDNDQDETAICRQLGLLAALAHHQGQAIGIGHPHQAMLTALSQCGAEALRSAEVAGVNRLLH